jgi:hypothetical protein
LEIGVSRERASAVGLPIAVGGGVAVPLTFASALPHYRGERAFGLLRVMNTRLGEHAMSTTQRHADARAPHENPEKDPEDWTTGDEPMTGPQRSYLTTLCQEAGEAFDETLTKAQASKRIDELQAKTGRGSPAS